MNFPMDKKRLSHNDLIKTDRSACSGRSVDFCSKAEVDFVVFNFPDLGPRAGLHGPIPFVSTRQARFQFTLTLVQADSIKDGWHIWPYKTEIQKHFNHAAEVQGLP